MNVSKFVSAAVMIGALRVNKKNFKKSSETIRLTTQVSGIGSLSLLFLLALYYHKLSNKLIYFSGPRD